MFKKSLKDIFVGKENTPISFPVCAYSPFIQELLLVEDKRCRQHIEENYNRLHGYMN